MKKRKHKIVIKSEKHAKKHNKITRKNKKKQDIIHQNIEKNIFFDDVFQENSKPKTIWIQELTPESALDPGADSWKPFGSRSWLLDPHGFQESAPGSRALSGVNSWIQMVFGFEFSWKTSSKKMFFSIFWWIMSCFFLFFLVILLCFLACFSDFVTILCLCFFMF